MGRAGYYLSAILITLMSLYACTDTSLAPFTDGEKKLIDSLYNFKIDSIRIHLDSLCDTTYQKVYDHAVDSIMDERISEIKKLLSVEE